MRRGDRGASALPQRQQPLKASVMINSAAEAFVYTPESQTELLGAIRVPCKDRQAASGPPPTSKLM